jgi:hypothetical protein
MRIFQNFARISISSAIPLRGEKIPEPHLIKKVDFYGINRADVKGLVRPEVVPKPHLRAHRNGILLEVRGI